MQNIRMTWTQLHFPEKWHERVGAKTFDLEFTGLFYSKTEVNRCQQTIENTTSVAQTKIQQVYNNNHV